jgi:hypothetical protein
VERSDAEGSDLQLSSASALTTYISSKGNFILLTVRLWGSRFRTRHQLRNKVRNMDISLIEKDVGLAPGTLVNEAFKPFWKP